MRIQSSKKVRTPLSIKSEFPISELASRVVHEGRKEIEAIIENDDHRLMVIVGPCSIHDEKAAYEYAHLLSTLREKYRDKLCIVMRVYFEKPRTTVGWKGLLTTPSIVGSSDFNEGRRIARRILLKINELGLPVATEILNPSTPQFIDDLVSWGAIGARTIESQTHREIASGLSFPVGMKNGTGGSVSIAVHAMLSAREPHHFLGIDQNTGSEHQIETSGNPYTQLILRGGTNGTNYDVDAVYAAKKLLEANELPLSVVIDCSHANSGKDYAKQKEVLRYVLKQRVSTDYPVAGVMIESNLYEGSQPEGPLEDLAYGVSITDACIGWEETEQLLQEVYDSV